MHAPHGTNLESRVLDALNDPAGEPPLDGVRLDDGQRPLGHSPIIAGDNSAIRRTGEDTHDRQPDGTPDPDEHKGAIEGDRPDDEQIGNPHDAVTTTIRCDAIDEDAIGATRRPMKIAKMRARTLDGAQRMTDESGNRRLVPQALP